MDPILRKILLYWIFIVVPALCAALWLIGRWVTD